MVRLTLLASAALLFAFGPGCSSTSGPLRYRLTAEGDAILDDLRPRYPAYFAIVLDPASDGEPDLRPLRDDLERTPVDRRNYDALNAIALGYFELNARAEQVRGDFSYLGESFRVAKLVAVPWRAYREIEDHRLRDAILDFFDDAASGERPASVRTSARLASVVASLEDREPDAVRRARIRAIAERLSVSAP